LPTSNIDVFRKRVNEFYYSQNLVDQRLLLLPIADAIARLDEITENLVNSIAQFEPFGYGNPQPIIKSDNLLVINVRKMGIDGQHVKLEMQDSNGIKMQFLSFNAPEHFIVQVGTNVSIWYHPYINEWQDKRTVEGQLLHLEIIC
jgi:single-stranded-DNA-specific exonuclease